MVWGSLWENGASRPIVWTTRPQDSTAMRMTNKVETRVFERIMAYWSLVALSMNSVKALLASRMLLRRM